MYKHNSVVVCGNRVFIVTNPYMMVVIERTRDGRTLKRVYHDPANLSEADKRDFLFARVVKNINEKYR
ncbi:MAG: hypothetical protein J6S57_03335 [Alphaproteobacteria bacterium]|nr:hypothetical protein [Alphaproteobacteria bacterium]